MLSLTLTLLLSQPTSPVAQTLDFAQQGYELSSKRYAAGGASMEQVATWATRLYEAEKTDPKALQRHLERLRDLEKRAQEKFNAGTATKLDVLTAGYLRAEAEALLSKK